MNAFDKLPYDISVRIEKETEKRFSEFKKFNSSLFEKMTLEEGFELEEWIETLTRYEFYRLYGVTKKDIPENDEMPEFRDLVKIEQK